MSEVLRLKKSGYCITSSRPPTYATRIDRKDWLKHMAAQHPGGMDWVSCLTIQEAADYYRRIHSTDTIIVHRDLIKVLPNSRCGPTKYRVKVILKDSE